MISQTDFTVARSDHLNLSKTSTHRLISCLYTLFLASLVGSSVGPVSWAEQEPFLGLEPGDSVLVGGLPAAVGAPGQRGVGESEVTTAPDETKGAAVVLAATTRDQLLFSSR
ncbi:hypothetical protein EUGRSUZ_C04224 [Eucalyptus grandis]|uniref:Uncharacterized protein n=2 Tax=Eucalyptus grandis TaxID=71139 RepID=A0ACC3LM44_EUCGR|nr:hypothetical protein EUGRSUZ_C04224 [Eucalyptus grandis]